MAEPASSAAPAASTALSTAGATRRRAMLAAGALALAAGAGFAWWRERAAPVKPDEQAPTALWQAGFQRPEGGELAMASLRGKPLLINFWATWCAPCIREMPMLDRFARAQAARGWQVLGLAIDSPTPVRQFLQERPVGFATALAGLEGAELLRQLGNPSGGLPFSVLINADGRIIARKLGELKEADLADWATRA